ncbi:hypothetical protein [Mycetocola miduiensis]|uniref:YdhG-like domain-containing protein n=1 Tax=Mycetocola miduiensis TaxID=995034 RepID=A0A1I4Z3T7_9MICO|nr:hypothetical protein [Mycetocola miduiensis]SFN44540.1 hypothetical protein SAMN05216219_0694 [Mycetocola miduiensis]
MPVTTPAEVEERLNSILDRYRPELVDGTIYGIPALVWPGATGHDYFAALKQGTNKVGLYLIIADRYPEDLELASDAFRSRRTGRATFSFASLDDTMEAELIGLLDRLMERYRSEHA